MTKFQVGKTYATRSIGDYNCVFSFTIVSRTDKTVTIKSRNNKPARRGITVYDGVEQFKPFGTYSMCAIISADERSIALAEGANIAA